MTYLLSALVFLLILLVIIVVHEFGHFITAKAFGVRVNEFGIGIPPRIWGKKIGETLYSINWLPLGGFVKIEGENDLSKPKPRSFGSVNRLKRSVILLAGVVMNFLLAIAILSIIFVQGIGVPSDQVSITEVAPGSPAETAGLKSGDKVVAVNGSEVTINDFSRIVKEQLGQPIDLTIVRDNKTLQLAVTPRLDPPAGQGALGIVLSQTVEIKSYPWYQAPVEATKLAFNLVQLNLKFLGDLVGGLAKGQVRGADQIAGPVGVAYVTYKNFQNDPGQIPLLIALFSLGIGIVNALPIPALDGGRLAFVLLSAVFRRDFYPKLESYIHQVGFILLLLLFVLITYNDLSRLITTTSLGGKLREIFQFIP